MSDLGGFSMWELFRGEVETQMGSFTAALLAVEEQSGSVEVLTQAMRAAHSIKGAARIVQLDAGVQLAHVMEDCLVAAQKAEIVLEPRGIDVLLRAADVLATLSTVQESAVAEWLKEHEAGINQLVSALGDVRAGKPPAAEAAAAAAVKPPAAQPAAAAAGAPSPEVPPVQAAPPEPPAVVAAPAKPGAAETVVAAAGPTAAPAPAAPAAKGAQTDRPSRPDTTRSEAKPSPEAGGADAESRSLRVGAQILNRLLSLAGDNVVQTRWLEAFADDLRGVKRGQSQLMDTLEKLRDSLPRESKVAHALLNDARAQLSASLNGVAERQAGLEDASMRATELAERLYRETVATRMRPFGEGVEAFPRLVRDLARTLGKKAKLEITGRDTPVDRDIATRLDAPLNHLVRNSLDHGLELPSDREAKGKVPGGTVRLDARHSAGRLVVTVGDDGRGVDIERLRVKIVERQLSTADVAANLTAEELLEFLFLPGFSTAEKVTEISGRGVGLDAVQEAVRGVGGSVRVSSELGVGTSFIMELPLTLSVIRTLVMEIAGEPFALPLTRVDRVSVVTSTDLKVLEGHHVVQLDGVNVGVVAAHELLGLAAQPEWHTDVPVVVLSDKASRHGFAVDRFLGEFDVVVRPLDSRLGKVRAVSSCAMLEDGSPVLILDADDLLTSLKAELQGGYLRGLSQGRASGPARKRVLVVEDSITVRELERSVLQSRGYEVVVAVDGMDGWNALREGKFDLVVSDVDMPRMTGLELVAQLRADARLRDVPVIIVSYKDREEDRLRGLEAGADRYMTKNSFHDASFLEAVSELIGRPA